MCLLGIVRLLGIELDISVGRWVDLENKLVINCDVIKQNESELAIIDFEIQPIIAFNFLCILLF